MLEWQAAAMSDERNWKSTEPTMQDGIYMADDRRAAGVAGGVSEFAAEVVARLVARDGVGGKVLREDLVVQFMDAVRAADAKAFERLKPSLKRARISASVLADIYVPEVARRLGRGWEEDTISFAEVTMGVARLQAILREIGSHWTAGTVSRDDRSTLLLILPAGEQHTLGAMVVAGWLRRQGISVCLRIAPSVADLVSLLSLRRFDGAMISIACNDKLDVCAKLVKTLKQSVDYDLRVAVGGALALKDEEELSQTGADIITNDLPSALSALGLSRRATRV